MFHFTLHIDRLIVLNTSRSNRCITVRDDATFSYVSAHMLQIFIFSSAGGTWRLACICELFSLPIPGLPRTDVNGALQVPWYS